MGRDCASERVPIALAEADQRKPVEGFAAGQVEGDDVAGGVRFCVDFRGEAAARATERLPFLPPLAPAADTCARTIVESNIGMRCGNELIAASGSKKGWK